MCGLFCFYKLFASFCSFSLQAQKLEKWKDEVTIISCDMRKWKAPEKADILVSELLGSFGDNELSPECLDGAQAFLNGNGFTFYNLHGVQSSLSKRTSFQSDRN